MQRFSRLRLTGLILVGLVITGCAEEPAPAPGAATAPAEATTENAPATAPEPRPAAAPDDSETVAQAIEEEETAGEPAADAADEPIRLAQDETPASAADARFKEGKHYRVLPVAQPTSVPPDKVEVAEVFWYGCPHCYTLEPHIEQWRAAKPANVEFIRIPAALNRNWQLHARVYYTAEALGVLDEVHGDLFREMHAKGNRLATEESLVEFFGRYGVSEEQFTETLNSFAVQTKLRQADSLVRRYRITGVPAVVVNGKYVTGADLAGGEKPLIEVVNFLVEKESS
jgi:thiol:disulfide interchange protein DsbA